MLKSVQSQVPRGRIQPLANCLTRLDVIIEAELGGEGVRENVGTQTLICLQTKKLSFCGVGGRQAASFDVTVNLEMAKTYELALSLLVLC